MKGTVLALDYGTVNIGVAVSDSERKYALAHGIVPAEPIEKAIEIISQIIQEEEAVHIVVGMPLTLQGERGHQAQKTEEFIEDLKQACGLSVDVIDERFSSAEAQWFAKQKGTPLDAEAARLLLETWLTSH